MKNIAFILIIVIFSSCATIINSKRTTIEIQSKVDNTFLMVNKDSLIGIPAIIDIPRSYYDFNLTIVKDSTTKIIKIKSKVAPEYKWGNLAFFYYCPIGYIIDANSRQKLFTYDKVINVNIQDNSQEYQNWFADKKGQLFFTSSIPFFNALEFDDGKGKVDFNRYFGLSLGFGYYYSHNSFVVAKIGATGISDLPFPVMDRFRNGKYVIVNSQCFKLNNFHDFDRFNVGYGINISRFHYAEYFADSISHKDTKLSSHQSYNLGANIEIQLKLNKYIYVGLSYLPSFYNITSGRFEYSHITYIDLGLNIPIVETVKQLNIIRFKPKYEY
jgi:uncharacterized protein YceK